MATAFSPSPGKSAVRPRTLAADNGRDADSVVRSSANSVRMSPGRMSYRAVIEATTAAVREVGYLRVDMPGTVLPQSDLVQVPQVAMPLGKGGGQDALFMAPAVQFRF